MDKILILKLRTVQKNISVSPLIPSKTTIHKIWYLDQNVFSDLAKDIGDSERAALSNHLEQTNDSVAISYNHILELAQKLTGTNSGNKFTFLPIQIEKCYGQLPTIKMKSPWEIYKKEWISYFLSTIYGTLKEKIIPYGLWDWMPNGKNASLTEAVSYILNKERGAKSEEKFLYLREKVLEHTRKVKVRVQKGEERNVQNFEEIFDIEKQTTLTEIAKYPEFWPRGPLLLSSTSVNLIKRKFIKNFNFSECPLINLNTGLWAYKRLKVLNQRMDQGDYMDFWHASVGCQYSDVFITRDRRLREILDAIRAYIPFRARIFESINNALLNLKSTF